jgi:hypothetical protein
MKLVIKSVLLVLLISNITSVTFKGYKITVSDGNTFHKSKPNDIKLTYKDDYLVYEERQDIFQATITQSNQYCSIVLELRSKSSLESSVFLKAEKKLEKDCSEDELSYLFKQEVKLMGKLIDKSDGIFIWAPNVIPNQYHLVSFKADLGYSVVLDNDVPVDYSAVIRARYDEFEVTVDGKWTFGGYTSLKLDEKPTCQLSFYEGEEPTLTIPVDDRKCDNLELKLRLANRRLVRDGKYFYPGMGVFPMRKERSLLFLKELDD